jgi:UDP-N-acetylmuramoyl-tripeptide--D-alanyl-D-alanine ligase
MNWLLAAACAVASIPAGLRWLRVAQREHYLAGEVTRFALRWWRNGALNIALDILGLAGVLLTVFDLRWGFLVAAVQIGPIGLSIGGVSSPLAWTDRLRRLAGVSGLVVITTFAAGALFSMPLLVVLPLYLLYVVVDLALAALAPLERRMGDQWVDKAAAKLRAVGPRVVAITGSYGKTTTKHYVAHLLSGSRRVVATPASFNNRMGLARAINENLTPGTEIFVAEMGTYGHGEIAELCRWITPEVAAMVAIGPVHLERFGSLDDIARAKSEILDRAEVGVICADDPYLAAIAAAYRGRMRILEVSAEGGIVIDGEHVIAVPEGVLGVNLAVALGIGRALGIDVDELLPRVAGLPTTEHRQSVTTAAAGFTIVDDTFNSNPAGARSALAVLAEAGAGGTTAVITPGMVELGSVQDEENRSFAEQASAQVDHLVIIGRTNRRSLREGSAKGKASVTVVDSRAEAVEWARAHLGPGDAVLYENDLPDHYP